MTQSSPPPDLRNVPLYRESISRPRDEYDVRGNKQARALAESLWAVRVLRGVPSWLEDVFWNHLRAIEHNTQDGLFPAHSMKLEQAQHMASTVQPSGVGLATIINDTEMHFKTGRNSDDSDVGMDSYIDSRTGSSYVHKGTLMKKEPAELAKVLCATPSGQIVTMCNRKQSIREEFFFHFRGRAEADETYLKGREEEWKSLLSTDFARNRHAGITVPQQLSDELRDFFPHAVLHGGKADYRSGNDAWEYRAFRVPFIGGASGSILYAALSMEDILGGQAPHGVVPMSLRVFLLALHCAVLIAGGQHSLSECLLTLQAMGYFLNVPQLMRGGSYYETVAAFETYLCEEGLIPFLPGTQQLSSPLGDLRNAFRVTRMEVWAIVYLSKELQSLHKRSQELWNEINATDPVLVKGQRPTAVSANEMLTDYEAQLKELWVPAFAYVEIATCSAKLTYDPLGLLELTRLVDPAWCTDLAASSDSRIIYATVLQNMLGKADVARFQMVAEESPPLTLQLTSVHVGCALKASGCRQYFIEATFLSSEVRELKSDFFTGVAVRQDAVKAYTRKSIIEVGLGRLATDTLLSEEPDLRTTLAYIREESISAVQDFLAEWKHRATELVSHSLVLETGRPHFHSKQLSQDTKRAPMRIQLRGSIPGPLKPAAVTSSCGSCLSPAMIRGILKKRLQTPRSSYDADDSTFGRLISSTSDDLAASHIPQSLSALDDPDLRRGGPSLKWFKRVPSLLK